MYNIVHFKFNWQLREPTCQVILMSATLLLASLQTKAASAGDVRLPKLRGVISDAAAAHKTHNLPTKYETDIGPTD